jgi:hypothetical protein
MIRQDIQDEAALGEDARHAAPAQGADPRIRRERGREKQEPAPAGIPDV